MLRFGFAVKSQAAPYHRMVVISDPIGNGGWIVVVLVTTRRDEKWEPDCVLTPAEWDQLDHESVIAFANAKGPVQCGPAWVKAIESGVFIVIPSPPAATMAKIIAAAKAPDVMAPAVRKWIP